MKIKMQIIEFLFAVSFIMFVFGMFFASKANILGTFTPLFIILATAIYTIVEVSISYKKYGHGIWYNRIFNTLEFHIGSLTDWNTIAIRVAKTRRVAFKKGVSVLFYTDHYEKERLYELAKKINLVIEIRRANWLQCIVYKSKCFVTTFYMVEAWKRKKHPVLRCIIDPSINKSSLYNRNLKENI
ncbi:hypothetical protein ABEW19_29975 [Paenibacillus illinoisensis]|uniref:hypothetical protein n=1 Tax=Paenibacillus illinoisensis TaxID=59845 RepID=UPI003D294FA9